MVVVKVKKTIQNIPETKTHRSKDPTTFKISCCANTIVIACLVSSLFAIAISSIATAVVCKSISFGTANTSQRTRETLPPLPSQRDVCR